MAQSSPLALKLLVLAVGLALGDAAHAVSRPPDPLDSAKGEIRTKHFAAAQTQLQKLASAGNPQAEYLLAVFYLNGLGGPRDVVQAKTWLEKAAGHGNAPAAFSLARLYAESDPPDPAAPPGQMGFRFDRAGVRIPTLAVSAYIDPQTVITTGYRNTSLIATLRARWKLGPR